LNLTRENHQLQSELAERNDEMEKLKTISDNKEQWEAHLGTIIQWVHDEKEKGVDME